MQDQVGLDGFPLDHEFPEDYGLEEEDDDMEIDEEPLFEEEVANQTVSRRSRTARASGRRHTCRLRTSSFVSVGGTLGKTRRCSKLWRHSRFNMMARPSISPIVGLSSTGRRSSRRNMPPSWRVGGKAVEDHGGGEKARPWGKTNSKKEDKWNTTLIALLEKVEGMISKKDLREEMPRQEKEYQMNAFMEIQRRRLEMDVKRQAKMLELEEAKQAKMLEIEATNAKTNAKEVAPASMKEGVEIMKVDLNTVSPRKRL
ncbi:Eyes absent-like protein 4 [Hordeum vulgare]|nr:Eyes absent-like protein 4 [Hordeum vulgare]